VQPRTLYALYANRRAKPIFLDFFFFFSSVSFFSLHCLTRLVRRLCVSKANLLKRQQLRPPRPSLRRRSDRSFSGCVVSAEVDGVGLHECAW